jgi:hypothetical protein
MRKYLATVAILATGFLFGGMVALTPAEAKEIKSQDVAVGAWEVQAVGAPYKPHLLTFEADGTMFTTNPTNVQEATSNTNDSVGMGTWHRDGQYIYGTFYQLNAFADTHRPADSLEVRFRIRVSGDQLTGDWFIAAFDARGTFEEGHRLAFKKWTAP